MNPATEALENVFGVILFIAAISILLIRTCELEELRQTISSNELTWNSGLEVIGHE